MDYRETRTYIVAAIILLLLGGVAFDFIGIASKETSLIVVGAILTFIGAIMIFIWMVKYLHELDERLEHVEGYLEETTRERR